jgi:hypothetical protein
VIVGLVGAANASADIGVESVRPAKATIGSRVVVRAGSGLKLWERMPLYLVRLARMPRPARCGATAICEPHLPRRPEGSRYLRIGTLSFRRAKTTTIAFRVPRLAPGGYGFVIYCGPCYRGPGGSLITNTQVTLTITGAASTVAFASGLSLRLPAGWHVTRPRLLEPCTNPIPRFAVRHGRDLLLVEESLDAAKYIARFSARPHRFTVKGQPSFMTCCAAAGAGRGWQLYFRDHHRGFYAYLYGNPRPVLRVLQSLRVQPK